MAFLYLIEIFVQIGLVIVVATQIVWPAVTGGHWFPLFRRGDVHRARVTAEEEVAQLREQEQIEVLKQEAAEIRSHIKEKS